jgi:hypothetical protein
MWVFEIFGEREKPSAMNLSKKHQINLYHVFRDIVDGFVVAIDLIIFFYLLNMIWVLNIFGERDHYYAMHLCTKNHIYPYCGV